MLRMMIFLSYCFICSISLAEISVDQEPRQANGLSYERRAQEKHVIHVLTIDPKLFRFELVKAHNAVFARETVASIARRKNAVAAINGGFFEIGRNEDGRPSGTLIINKKIFSLASGTRSLLLVNDNTLKIRRAEITLNLQRSSFYLPISLTNRFAGTNDIAFYTSVWGSHSLTSFNRKDIALDAYGKIIQLAKHGDIEIPKDGFVLSFPEKYQLPALKLGNKLSISTKLYAEEKGIRTELNLQNAISGIPLLVLDGTVTADLNVTGSKHFAAQPQARTALGLRSDGKVVMVVVEHVYTQLLGQVTLAQVANILHQKKFSKAQLATMTLPKIRKTVEEHLLQSSSEIGLTLLELANTMKDLGCTDAINLDGGGSSSLFLHGQTVNKAFGDADEGFGLHSHRAVSDAIVVIKRN